MIIIQTVSKTVSFVAIYNKESRSECYHSLSEQLLYVIRLIS